MRIAFLILAHNNPVHLHRLIDALSHENTHCFLHIDKKSSLPTDDFQNDSRVSLCTKRVKVHWGDFSMIKAIMALMQKALGHTDSFDRIVLLSGSDYPTKPMGDLLDFFAQDPVREYINITKMPDKRAGKPIERLTQYKIYEGGHPAQRAVSRLLAKATAAPRERSYSDALGSMTPYGGSTWWALTCEACRHLIDFSMKNKTFYSYFRNAYYPDEMLFHTILGNSPFINHTARNLTYTDWSQQLANPAILNQSHLAALKSGVIEQGHDSFGEGPMFFARKFNDESDALIQALET